MKKVDVCIIGGGASGLVSACVEKGKVTVIEKADRVGKKILLTGNGRCNLSNVDLDQKYYSNPIFYQKVYQKHKKALDLFMESLNLFTRVDNAGRIYPYSNHASSVLDALRLKAEKNAEIVTNTLVQKVIPQKNGYQVVTDKEVYFAKKVIYSCGGGEFSPIKDICKTTQTTQKMLCPIETETDKIRGLDGVRVFVKVRLLKNGKEIYAESGEALFRQYGLSGVAIFNCSSYIARDIVKGKKANYIIEIDFLDGLNVSDVRKVLQKRAKEKEIEKLFVGLLQRKIGERILKNLAISPEKELNDRDIESIICELTHFSLKVKKLKEEGAQVVSGGVVTDSLTDNLEVTSYKNLHIVGEAVDMDGVCGGYNLHWAFLSAIGASENEG